MVFDTIWIDEGLSGSFGQGGGGAMVKLSGALISEVVPGTHLQEVESLDLKGK